MFVNQESRKMPPDGSATISGEAAEKARKSVKTRTPGGVRQGERTVPEYSPDPGTLSQPHLRRERPARKLPPS